MATSIIDTLQDALALSNLSITYSIKWWGYLVVVGWLDAMEREK